jgi:hypothetical protein
MTAGVMSSFIWAASVLLLPGDPESRSEDLSSSDDESCDDDDECDAPFGNDSRKDASAAMTLSLHACSPRQLENEPKIVAGTNSSVKDKWVDHCRTIAIHF